MDYKEKLEKIRTLFDIKSNSVLEKFLNLSNGYLSNIENNESTNPGKLITALITKGVSADWFLTGEGDMTLLNKDTTMAHVAETIPTRRQEGDPELKRNQNGNGVPFYEMDAAAHVAEMLDTKVEPDFYVDFQPFNDCSAYLPVYGDSMYPSIKSGDIVALKKLNNFDIILWGEAHLVVTNSDCNNLRTVKLIFEHEENNKIILRSSNPNYKGDTIIYKEHILGMYIVKGVVTRKQL